jgi:hypothetical protein
MQLTMLQEYRGFPSMLRTGYEVVDMIETTCFDLLFRVVRRSVSSITHHSAKHGERKPKLNTQEGRPASQTANKETSCDLFFLMNESYDSIARLRLFDSRTDKEKCFVSARLSDRT